MDFPQTALIGAVILPPELPKVWIMDCRTWNLLIFRLERNKSNVNSDEIIYPYARSYRTLCMQKHHRLQQLVAGSSVPLQIQKQFLFCLCHQFHEINMRDESYCLELPFEEFSFLFLIRLFYSNSIFSFFYASCILGLNARKSKITRSVVGKKG